MTPPPTRPPTRPPPPAPPGLRNDAGSILILTLGLLMVALLLVLAVADASAVLLARRDLAADADAAALAAAQQLDRAAVYRGGLSGSALPLDPAQVQASVARFTAAQFPAARYPGYAFRVRAEPGAVVVSASRLLRLPVFGEVTVVARSSAAQTPGP